MHCSRQLCVCVCVYVVRRTHVCEASKRRRIHGASAFIKRPAGRHWQKEINTISGGSTYYVWGLAGLTKVYGERASVERTAAVPRGPDCLYSVQSLL